MELYKIMLAEFEKFKDEDGYFTHCCGTTSKTYHKQQECIDAMKNELEYIRKRPYYEKIEELHTSDNEFKLKCTVKHGRKIVIHHYKIVKFSS